MSKKTAPASIQAVPALLVGAAAIDKEVGLIKLAGDKMQKRIHVAALSALQHHAEHGDITLMNRLLLALPKSTRRNALALWAVQNAGNLGMNTDKAAAKDAPLVHLKGVENRLNLEAANAKPFWDVAAKEDGKSWSFDNYMDTLTKGLSRALKEQSMSDAQKLKLTRALNALNEQAEA